MKIYQVVHYYEDGDGDGYATQAEKVIANYSDPIKAKEIVDKYSKPHIYAEGIYGAPRCGTLVVREVVIDEDPNPETFWWLNNEEYYENDEWDDDWYKYEA